MTYPQITIWMKSSALPSDRDGSWTVKILRRTDFFVFNFTWSTFNFVVRNGNHFGNNLIFSNTTFYWLSKLPYLLALGLSWQSVALVSSIKRNKSHWLPWKCDLSIPLLSRSVNFRVVSLRASYRLVHNKFYAIWVSHCFSIFLSSDPSGSSKWGEKREWFAHIMWLKLSVLQCPAQISLWIVCS